MIHVLIAADELRDDQIDRIAAALDGWGQYERISPKASPETWAETLKHVDIVFGTPPVDVLKNSTVKLVQLASVGYDSYDGQQLGRKKDLIVCNARGTMGPEIAEHALAMMLAQVRQIPQHVRDAATRTWRRAPWYGELFESTVCIIGLGDLGTELAKRCQGLGMRVVGARRDTSKGHDVAEHVYGLDQLPQAVAEADHIVAILPASSTTAKIIDANVFAACKPGARFYNVGRGSTVDEQALIQHLQSGQLAGAGLDVFEEEPLPASSALWGMENVIIMPHVAGRSDREYDRLCALLIDNVQRYHEGRPLRNVLALDA